MALDHANFAPREVLTWRGRKTLSAQAIQHPSNLDLRSLRMARKPRKPRCCSLQQQDRPDGRRAGAAYGPLGACASARPGVAAYVSMENIATPHSTNPHEELRRRLALRYGILGEYVGAATVARILGLGLTTVYEQSRAGRFVIPHRLSNRKPLFLLDDLVSWMTGTQPIRDATVGASSTPAATRVSPCAHVFKHPEAEEAFLRVCRARGIKPPKERHR